MLKNGVLASVVAMVNRMLCLIELMCIRNFEIFPYHVARRRTCCQPILATSWHNSVQPCGCFWSLSTVVILRASPLHIVLVEAKSCSFSDVRLSQATSVTASPIVYNHSMPCSSMNVFFKISAKCSKSLLQKLVRIRTRNLDLTGHSSFWISGRDVKVQFS